MKAKKLLALLLAAAMTFAMVGCGGDDADNDTPVDNQTTDETTPTPEPTEEPTEAPTDPSEEDVTPAATEASIDFEDGLFGFVYCETSLVGGTGPAELSVVDYNGSKALQAVSGGKYPCLAIPMDQVLGDQAGKVATIDVTVGAESADGNFYAVSGNLWGVIGGGKDAQAWSVYLETANPKVATYTVPDGSSFAEGDVFAISMEVDNCKSETGNMTTLYIDNITFKDASGNVLAADTSVVAEVASGAADRSNLYAVSGAVEFEGFATKGDGWAQAGFTMPQEILDALVPGSVVEISYTSENGDMWIVMNEAAAGWMRVGDGNNGSAYVNNSKNIVQIPYEMIAEYCTDDVSTWGTTMQCEASGAWEVYSVKVGQKGPNYALGNAVEFEGFATKGDGWAQAGFTMPQEILDALVPGSMVEISYTSENGDMWLVMNEAAAGWMRVGDGNNGQAVTDGSKAYIPYEMIAEYCTDDVSTWGTTMQCEASGAWEVYSVRVGTALEFSPLSNVVEFEGFATKGDGWAQAGFTMPQEILDALVPGSVVSISYASENGDMWIVMNEAAAGWMRVGDGNNGQAVCDGSTCQVTYEMIAEYCGDDVSTWGTTMQCEASGAWEVYSVSVGKAN